MFNVQYSLRGILVFVAISVQLNFLCEPLWNSLSDIAISQRLTEVSRSFTKFQAE
jgi:hypothetical protein